VPALFSRATPADRVTGWRARDIPCIEDKAIK
jgi:hypothetical protein